MIPPFRYSCLSRGVESSFRRRPYFLLRAQKEKNVGMGWAARAWDSWDSILYGLRAFLREMQRNDVDGGIYAPVDEARAIIYSNKIR